MVHAVLGDKEETVKAVMNKQAQGVQSSSVMHKSRRVGEML